MPTTAAGIAREHVEHWLVDLAERRSASTVATRYGGLQQLFKWLEDEGEIERFPMVTQPATESERSSAGVERSPPERASLLGPPCERSTPHGRELHPALRAGAEYHPIGMGHFTMPVAVGLQVAEVGEAGPLRRDGSTISFELPPPSGKERVGPDGMDGPSVDDGAHPAGG